MDIPRPRHAHTVTDLENSAQVENTLQRHRHQTICSLSVELIITVHAVVCNHGYHQVFSCWVTSTGKHISVLLEYWIVTILVMQFFCILRQVMRCGSPF